MTDIKKIIKQAEFFERAALYGDHLSFLGSFAQDAGVTSHVSLSPEFDQVEQKTTPSSIPAPTSSTVTPDTNQPSPVKPATPKMPQLDKATITTLQIMLNNFLRPQIIAGKASPIEQDGIFGKETIGALKQWGKYYGFNTNDLADLVQTAIKK